ncbi:MAG: hypothetical protein IPO21_05605 [Bacteroidales bacterium]|nr:hypothetical protein [Bacteroidales bacterium]
MDWWQQSSIFPYNRVISKRQVGSTFKPIVYYTALENGVSPCDYFSNERIEYSDYENWSPGNSNGEYNGFYSMKGALANSVNTVSAKILFEAGIDNVISNAKKMGITSYLPKVPSIVLGVADASLYEMVTAYSAFANGGFLVDLYTIESIKTKDGKVIYKKKKPSSKEILNREFVNQLVKMMQSTIDEGTGQRIRTTYGISGDIAGKTGTTQNNADGWFIGFTPKLVVGVWMGLDNPSVRFQDTYTGQNSNTALPIWAMGYSKTVRNKWGRKYIGNFEVDSLETTNCENFVESLEDTISIDETPEGLFELLFGNRRKKRMTEDSLNEANLINDTITTEEVDSKRKKRRLFRKNSRED